jgi:3-dehydroquinate synthase
MQKKTIRFGTASTDFYFGGGFSDLKEIVDAKNTILITDENVFKAHQKRFTNWNTIVLKPGEEYKIQATVDSIVEQLIEMEADRKTTLVGIGGGVITDLTGYVASVYMRGVRFGFVPTSLLALVDASIGGKNGIDVGVYKNMVGVIRQPSFILHDLVFLNSLPENEWRNGFAEIIKHACIKNAAMFRELEKNDLAFYRKRKKEASQLIQRNALIKIKVVQQDEFEQGDRKLLNFGHTLGHALENQYELSHGEAISIGMTYASSLSEQINGFRQTDRIVGVLEKYGLPTLAQFDKDKVIGVLKMDKKKTKDSINFILLEKIGKAVIQPISIDQLYQRL